MVGPQRLLDPIGFQDSMRGIPADLTTSVKALVDGWLATTTKAVDTITPKCPLHCRAHSAPWFNQQLQAMKSAGRTFLYSPQSIWNWSK